MTTPPSDPSERRLRERMLDATDGIEPTADALALIQARVTTRSHHRRIAAAVGVLGVLLLGLVGAALLARSDQGSSPYVGSGEPRYLVPPAGTPDLKVGIDPERRYYGASFVDPSGQTLVLRVYEVPLGTAEWQRLLEAAPTANLPNGLTVKLVCGGSSISSGSESGSAGGTDPGEQVVEPAGPLTATWSADGGSALLEAHPEDTGECTPPTVADGPLVDAAATLRWVDQAEFDRLLADSPPPQTTDPTSIDDGTATTDDGTATTDAPSPGATVPPDDVDAAVTAALPADARLANQIGLTVLTQLSQMGGGCVAPGSLVPPLLEGVEQWEEVCLRSVDVRSELTLTTAAGFPNLAFDPDLTYHPDPPDPGALSGFTPLDRNICARRIVGNWWSYYSAQGLPEPCSAGFEFQGG